MNRVRGFFLREAGECLEEIGVELGKDRMDVRVVHAAIRRFRGSAQMARFDGVASTARALEERLRRYVADERGSEGAKIGGAGIDGVGATEVGTGEAAGALRHEVRDVLGALRTDLEAVREGRLEEDPRMEAGMEERRELDAGEDHDVVPIETLEYRGGAALERAMSLREPLEDAIVSDDPAGPILDELFDLVRLGAK